MRIRNETGAVLVLLGLCLGVVLLFVALAVDTAMLGTSHQKQARTAEMGALAAVEAFLSAAGTREQKFDAAKTRAEEVVGFGLNAIVSDAKNSQASAGSIGDSTTVGSRGFLEAGQYFFAEPAPTATAPGVSGCQDFLSDGFTNNQNCPCPNNRWEGECFRPHANAAELNGGRPTTAFKLNLNTDSSNPVKTLFAGVAGGPASFPLSSSAISTITPRHIVFLIDMSSSMTSNTHFLNGNPKGKVAFRVPTPCITEMKNSTTALGTNCTYLDYQEPAPPGYELDETPFGFGRWEEMSECREPGSSDLIYNHYRNDYKCYDLLVEGNPQSYLVDTLYDSANPRLVKNTPAGPVSDYTGPQPLSTVFEAIHQTLLSLQVLAVPGDEVTFIAYDQSAKVAANNKRVIGPVGPESCTGGSTSDFCKLFRLTDVADYTQAAIDERVESLLFPLIGANTDFSEALLRAYEILSDAEGAEISDNQIIAFGDGLGNCTHSALVDRPYIATTLFLQNEPFDLTNPETPFRHQTCGNSLNEYLEAISEVIALATGQVRPLPTYIKPLSESGFKLHAFMFGESVQPHTLLLKGNARCMTEAEARELDIPYADDGSGDLSTATSPDTASAATPFVRTSYDFQFNLVRPTGGRFLPVRTACDPVELKAIPNSGFLPGDPFDCEAGDGIKALDNYCASFNLLDYGDPIVETYANVLRNGRLICDPRCIGASEQVKVGIDDLLKDNPIINVEPGPRVNQGVTTN